MYAILRIVGSITVDLLEPPYALVADGWAPSIATRVAGTLGGRGLFTDVPEEITIDIYDDTAPEVLQDAADLSQVLDEANAWAQGEDIDPVLLEVQLEGSALDAPLQAVIIGGGSDGYLQLPAGTQMHLIDARIDDVTLTLTRRGQLLGAEQTIETTSAVANPTVATIDSLDDLKVPSPTIVKLTNFSSTTALAGSGFVLVTDVTPVSTYGYNFTVLDESDMTYGAQFTQTADTTNDAVGGNVARINAASYTEGTITFSAVAAEVKRVTCFVALRNNSSTTTWQIRVRSGGLIAVSGRWYTVTAETTNPVIMNLHYLQNEARRHENFYIDVKTAYSTGTLDINYLAILGHGRSTHYVAIIGDTYTSAGYAHNIVIDHRALTHDAALAYIETSET